MKGKKEANKEKRDVLKALIPEATSEENSKEETKEDSGAENTFPESVEKKQEGEAVWLLIILVVVILGIFLGAWVISESNKFKYADFNWQETTLPAGLKIYTAKIEGINSDEEIVNFTTIFRNKPKTLEKIVSLEGNISITAKRKTYFSANLSANVNECGAVAPAMFTQFMNGIKFGIVTAVATNESAIENNVTFADCTNKAENTVILLTKGNETKIVQDEKNPNCYILTFNKCDEDIRVIERFEAELLKQLQSIEEYEESMKNVVSPEYSAS
ncbi:MAG: hypothetical protein WC533_00330 [Candidatus Pacearchaeota archaeon]